MTDPLHMEPAHRHFGQWDREEALAWAGQLGCHVREFMEKLLGHIKVRDQGYRIHGSFKVLAKDFGVERLDGACRRALDIGATSVSSLRSILRNNLDRAADNTPEDGLDADFIHGNIRGPGYYH